MPYERQTHCANGHELTPENVYVGTREDGRQFRQCKPCRRAWDAAKRSSMTVEERQKWRSRFPSQSREKMRGYQQKYRFEKRYGISVHDAKQLLSEQDGLCAICYDTEPATHLDHDHETGKVVLDLAKEELNLTLAITAEPLLSRVFLWEKVMAQYNLGHPELLKRIDAALENYPILALAGNGYRGIGIPDCIHSGELAVNKLTENRQAENRSIPAFTAL